MSAGMQNMAIAALVIVVLLLVYSRWRSAQASKEGFGDAEERILTQGVVDALTGVEYDNVGDEIPAKVLEGAAKKLGYLRLTPEEQAELDAQSATAAEAVDRRGVYEPRVAGGDLAAEVEQCHAQQPVDYGEVALAAVADSSMLARQRSWFNGMARFSGAAGIRNLDPIDVTASIKRTGLYNFNPSPVVQTNPLQVTEIDAYALAANPRQNFSF